METVGTVWAVIVDENGRALVRRDVAALLQWRRAVRGGREVRPEVQAQVDGLHGVGAWLILAWQLRGLEPGMLLGRTTGGAAPPGWVIVGWPNGRVILGDPDSRAIYQLQTTTGEAARVH